MDDAALRRAMRLAAAVSAAGEILGSMVMEIWVYRKGYVPLYVPLGHAIVIASGFQILRFAVPPPWRRAIIADAGAFYFALIAAAWLLGGRQPLRAIGSGAGRARGR